jgi:predicted nucleic acid-binding protein
MDWRPEPVSVSSIPPDLNAVALDRGERDTLALAQSLGNVQVLIDETIGRAVARSLGLKVRGSLAVLVDAYRRQLISKSALRSYFAEIAERQDIWINPALVKIVLQEALQE